MDASEVQKKNSANGHDLMNRLPDDCVEKILSFVSSPPDRCNSAAVSKKWLLMLANTRVVERGDINSSLSLSGTKANDFRLAALAVRAYYWGSLTRLFVMGKSNSPSISDCGLEIIAKASPSLKALSLSHCVSVGDAGFNSVGRWCEELEFLDLINCRSVTDEGLMSVANNCSKLSKLSLDSCQLVSSRSLMIFASKCLKLKSITIVKCPLVEDSGIISIALNLPALERIKLAMMKIGDSALNAIGFHGKALLSVHLEKITGPTTVGYSWIGAKSEELTYLKLRSCIGLTGHSFKDDGLANKFAVLKMLDIKGCQCLTDDALTNVSRSAQSVRTLKLEECAGFTSGGFKEALANWKESLKILSLKKCYIIETQEPKQRLIIPSLPENYPSLATLELTQCGGVGDSFLSGMALACSQVKNICLANTSSVTNQGLISLLNHLNAPNILSRLDLSGCTMIGQLAIQKIVTFIGAGLKSLRLVGLGGLNDWTIAVIAERCVALKDLNVAGCAVTDEGIWCLTNSGHNRLHSLSLEGCTRITDSSLELLEDTEWSELEMLNVRGCRGITVSGIESLQMVRWKCQLLC